MSRNADMTASRGKRQARARAPRLGPLHRFMLGETQDSRKNRNNQLCNEIMSFSEIKEMVEVRNCCQVPQSHMVFDKRWNQLSRLVYDSDIMSCSGVRS